jgi:hypothetical protein
MGTRLEEEKKERNEAQSKVFDVNCLCPASNRFPHKLPLHEAPIRHVTCESLPSSPRHCKLSQPPRVSIYFSSSKHLTETHLRLTKSLHYVVRGRSNRSTGSILIDPHSFVFTCGETEFSSYLKGYEGVQCQCHNCGNYSAHVMTRWPWFTFCFIVSYIKLVFDEGY